MSDSKKKKEKKEKAPTRSELIEENKKLLNKIEYRKRKEKKLLVQLDALSEELRAALLSVAKQRADAKRPTPLITALPAPPVAPTNQEIACAAYHLYLQRCRTGQAGTPESDWFQAQSHLWQKAAQEAHHEAVRLSQAADSQEPLQSSG
ncbi:MAG: hypothetical protein AAGD22_11265 [Verrucomicrobiota bacterium]